MNPNYGQPPGFNYNINYIGNQIGQDPNKTYTPTMANPYSYNMYNPNLQMFGNYMYNPNNQPISNPPTIPSHLSNPQIQVESNPVNPQKVNQKVQPNFNRRISEQRTANTLFLKSTEKPIKSNNNKMENMTPKNPEKLITDLHIKKVEHQINIVTQEKVKEYKLIQKEIKTDAIFNNEKNAQKIVKEENSLNMDNIKESSLDDLVNQEKIDVKETYKKAKTYRDKDEDISEQYHFITPGESQIEDIKVSKQEQKTQEKLKSKEIDKIEEKNESLEEIDKLNLQNNEDEKKEQKNDEKNVMDSPFKLMMQSQGDIQASIILIPEKKEDMINEINKEENSEPLEIIKLKQAFHENNDMQINQEVKEDLNENEVKIEEKEEKEANKDKNQNTLSLPNLQLESINNENKHDSKGDSISGSYSIERIAEMKPDKIHDSNPQEIKHSFGNYQVPDIKNLQSHIEIEEPFFPQVNDEEESNKNKQALISSTISLKKESLKHDLGNFPLISPRINPINIGLCNDAHSSLLKYFSQSKSIAICEACSKHFKDQGSGIIPIKEYIMNYGDKLHDLLASVNRIFRQTAINRNQSSINEQVLNDIEYKFDEYIDQINKCKLLIKNIVRKEMNENFKIKNEETILQIIERLKSQSNEYNNAMHSGKFVEILSMIDNEYLEKQRNLLQEIEKKPQNIEATQKVKNVIHLPNTGLSTMLKQLGITLLDNELGSFSQELEPEANFQEISWHDGSKVYSHLDKDKIITFSTNKPIYSDFKASIRIKRFSIRNNLSIGLSKVWHNLESELIGLGLVGNQVGIMPNSIIEDRGNPIVLRKKGFELKEGDIVSIIMESDNVTFEINSMKCDEYVCKNFKPPVYIFGSLYNQGDQLEILKIEKIH